MPQHRVSDVARLVGVSSDTVRRWIEAGDVVATGSPLLVDGASLADFLHRSPDAGTGQSIRNHLAGIVTKITSDPVMSQVELQCGPYRVVSLISTEAVTELGLVVGDLAAAGIKATNVSIEKADLG